MLMQTNSIETIEAEDSFGAANAAISSWERVIADTQTRVGEIRRLEEESQALSDEEQALLADDSLNEGTAAKRLNELRARKELKQIRLKEARVIFGSNRQVLSQTELAELEHEAAELETAIKANVAEETEIFRGAGGRGLEATNRLTKLRAERDSNVAKREKILGPFRSHEAAVTFRASQAREEAQRQINSLVKRLIRNREVEAERLVDILCINHKGTGLRLTSHFRSVTEPWRLYQTPSDPSEARQLVEQIRAMWNVEPLAPLLRVCEQEQILAGITEGAHACQ